MTQTQDIASKAVDAVNLISGAVSDLGDEVERLRAENADLKASLAAMAGLTGEQAEQLQAENERLRTLVCAAYCEGFGDGHLWREAEEEHTEERHDADVACGSMWPRSKACAALAGDDG